MVYNFTTKRWENEDEKNNKYSVTKHADGTMTIGGGGRNAVPASVWKTDPAYKSARNAIESGKIPEFNSAQAKAGYNARTYVAAKPLQPTERTLPVWNSAVRSMQPKRVTPQEQYQQQKQAREAPWKISTDGLMLKNAPAAKSVPLPAKPAVQGLPTKFRTGNSADLRLQNAGVIGYLPTRVGQPAPTDAALRRRAEYQYQQGRQGRIAELEKTTTFHDLLTKQGKLSADEKLLAKKMIQEREKIYNARVRDAALHLKAVSEDDQAFSMETTALKNRVSGGTAATMGFLNSASGFRSLDKAGLKQNEAAVKLAAQINAPAVNAAARIAQAHGGKSAVQLAAEQNPVAYGAGSFAGESFKYMVLSPFVRGIPGVDKLAKGTGSAVAKMTGGKISAAVAERLTLGRIADLPLDVINAALDTDNVEDFAKNLGIYQATGLAADIGFEGLTFSWHKIREAAQNGRLQRIMDPDAIREADVDAYLRDYHAGDAPKSQMLAEQPTARNVSLPTRKEAGRMKLTDPFNLARYRIEIDNSFSGVLPSGSDIVVGRTPDILVQFGAPDKALHLSQSTARKIVYPTGYLGLEHGHNLGMSVLKNLPSQLEDPIAILKNPQPNAKGLDSLVVLTEWYDQNGLRIVSPVHLNAKGAIDVQNNIASTFGADYMDRLLGKNGENIIYTKNNEDIRKLLSTGVESPKAMADDIFADTSIPQQPSKINGQNGGNSGGDFGRLPPEDPFRQAAEQAQARAGEMDPLLRDTLEIRERRANVPGLPADGLPGQKKPDAPVPEAVPLEKQLKNAYAQKNRVWQEINEFERQSGITPHEKEQAKAVQEGIIQLKQLDAASQARVGQYTALLEKLDEAGRPIKEHNAARHAALDEQMADLLEGSDRWKDKKAGWLYSRETMERNMEDIIPDAKEAARINQEIFTPIHQNEAKRQRFLNEWRGKVRALGLSAKESELVQMLGEGKISISQIPQNMDAEKIAKAAAVMRDEIYPELLNLANDALVRNGYRPVKPLKNYFPHFNDPSDPLLKALDKFGIKVNSQELPTDIAGLTHTFRPGKQWFGNFMERNGDKTVYDALRGFDMYIEGVSNVIHHTGDIQRLRAFEQAARVKYSDSGLAERIKAIRKNADFTPEEQEQQIAALLNMQENSHLPHFVTNLRNYTDGLAGKKAIGDRGWEQETGRAVYSTMQSLEGRVAANMVAVNPGSWLTNFIPLTQAGDVKIKNLVHGMWDTLKDNAAGLSRHLRGLRDGIVDESDFLTNRRGSDLLAHTKLEAVQGTLSRPMTWIDDFTSGSIVRAKYWDNIEKGLDHASALRNADDYAARLIADRSKGALPTVFQKKNPVAKLLTMFQVEVNNQLSFLFKDMPKYARERGKLKVAASLAKYAVGAYIFNDVYERFVGRRPALDPLGMLNEAVGDAAGYELPNITQLPQVVEHIGQGSAEDFRTGQEGSITKAGTNLAKNVAESLPFIGGVIGGGRVPVSSAIPDVPKLWNAVSGGFSGDIKPEVAWSRTKRELIKPTAYLLPPVGGGQIKKTVEGVTTVIDGGAYTLNAEGKRQLQFPAEQTIGNFAKGAIFGKYALPEGQAYVKGGFKPMLTADETAAMDRAENIGIESKDFLRLALAMKGQKPDKDAAGKIIKSGSDRQRDLLLEYKTLTPEQKRLMDTFLISKDDSPSRNYKSEDDFIISQMGDNDRVLWKREDVREMIGDAETFFRVMEAVRDVEPDKDKYGNAKTGSAKYKKVGVISQTMQIPYSEAGEVYEELFENKHAMSDFSSAQRERYERGPAKIGVTDEQFIDCMNLIRDVKADDDMSLNDMRVKTLTEAGYPKQDAQAFVKSMFQDKYSLEDLSEKETRAYQKLHSKYKDKMTERVFIRGYNAVSQTKGKKGKNGRTISGSQKKARYQALLRLGFNSKGAREFLIALYDYKDEGWV